MKARPRSMVELMMALAGPMIWAAHFFFLYLTEALACSRQGLGSETMRWIGAMATVAALAMAFFALRLVWGRHGWTETAEAEKDFCFAAPLILLSMVAIIWTSMPLLLLPTCAPGPV